MSSTIFNRDDRDGPVEKPIRHSKPTKWYQTELKPPKKQGESQQSNSKINLNSLTFVTSATTLVGLAVGGFWVGQQYMVYKDSMSKLWTYEHAIELEYERDRVNPDYNIVQAKRIRAIHSSGKEDDN